MTKLLGLVSLLPQIVAGLFGWLNKKEDTAVVENNNSKDVSVAIVQAETSRLSNVKGITLNAMDHPVWWVAWSLGVFPVLTYHACVFFVSTFPWLGWEVLRVPQDQIEFAHAIINWMFGIGGASALVTGVTQAWAKRA